MEPFSAMYIKMAAAAGELQDLHPNTAYKGGDFILSKDLRDPQALPAVVILRENESMEGWVNPKWIPRVDELKEMFRSPLPKVWEQQGRNGEKRYYDPDQYYGPEEIIGFVMAHRYDKVWNGSEWVAA